MNSASMRLLIAKKLILTCSLGLLMALPAYSQVPKIGLVDLRKVFDNYWKTKQADANLKEEAASLDKAKKSMVDDFTKSQETYKKLLDSANDAAVSTEERDKRKKSAEEELLKLKELQNNIEQFDRQARSTLGEKQRRMRDKLLDEIKEVIKGKAKAASLSLVIDTAAETVNNTPVLFYTNGENDITDDILTQLNANAPAPSAKPIPDSKPAELAPAKGDKK
jgi:outer membrane protein